MSLKSLSVKNFSVFGDEEINLTEGVNVFIGSNGTGKTQLLKGIYGCCEASRTGKGESFIDCFQLNIANRTLIKDISSGSTSFMISDGCSAKKIELIVADGSSSSAITFITYPQKAINAIYIPVKDMLTHSKGLLAMANRYQNFPFDKTLLDIIDRAQRWTVKETSDLVKRIIPLLEKCMEGTISIESDEFYIVKSNGSKINFELEAEGFKKIGVLWQLLMNETLVPGSVLLWDEPEANLNPEYIPIIANTLLELGRSGIQVFISTHSYMLAKYIDIRRKYGDNVCFHSFYKEDADVHCETKNHFSSLEHNSIMNAYEALLDEVYQQKVGG